jgi:hypothetical protein
MKVDQSFEKILTTIKELENRALKSNENGDISKIEMDLLKQRVRELYDQLLALDDQLFYQNASSISTNKQSAGTEPEQESQKAASQAEEKFETDKEPKVTSDQTSIHSEEKTEPVTEPKKTEASKPATPPKYTQVNETQTSKNSQEVVADKYQNTKTFRHDNLAKQQSKNDLSSKMQSKPIKDLSKAIGVNDKFLFIRELFDGNREHYHEAIQLLNEIPTYEEAENYLKETFDWDWEAQVTKKFIELIRRKFAENQE